MTITFPDGSSEVAPTPGSSEAPVSENNQFIFESSTLETFAAGAKADGEMEKVGTDDYFTIIYSVKSKVDTSTKTWADEYT